MLHYPRTGTAAVSVRHFRAHRVNRVTSRVCFWRVFCSGLSRGDVLVQTGVKYVVVLEGNADFLIPGPIGNPAEEVTADQIIQAHRQMTDAPCPGNESLRRHVESGPRLPVPAASRARQACGRMARPRN